MSTCCSEEKLLDLVLNELTGDEADAIQAHTKECADCRQLLADYTFSVSFFQNRLGDIPDMPRKLSQAHFKEIITTARELEEEKPNIWSKPVAENAAIGTHSDNWGRTIAWSVAAAFAIAFGIALFVKQPWQQAQPHHLVQDDPTSDPEQPPPPVPGPKLTPEPSPRTPLVVDIPQPSAPKPPSPGTHTQPKPTPNTENVVVQPTPEPKPDPVVVQPTPEPKPDPVVVQPTPEPKPDPVVVQPTPETKPLPDVTPDPKGPPSVVAATPARAEMTLYSLARNQLPRRLKTTPDIPNDEGLTYTPTGYVRKISDREADKYRTPNDTVTDFIDKRDLYELEYKTDDTSANRLIDISERILMAGGISARSIRFKPRSKTLETIGNRQELMAIHRTQEFLCDPNQQALNLSVPITDAPAKGKRERTPFVICFSGHAIEEGRLKKAMPVALFRRIKETKTQEAEEVKSSKWTPGINKDTKDNDKTDKPDKAKDSSSRRGWKRSFKGQKRANKKLGAGDDPAPPRPAPGPGPAPPIKEPKDPIVEEQIRRGLSLWNGKNSDDENEPVRVELTANDFGGDSYLTLEKLTNVKISKKVTYRKRDFNYIMKQLCAKANVPLIDISDQSEAELSLSLEHISVYDAIEFLCRRVNVKVLYTGEGVISAPAPHPDALQTVLFKIDSIPLRLKLRQVKSIKNFLMDNGIKFPKGAGASITRDRKELIIHNNETQLLKATAALELRKWGE